METNYPTPIMTFTDIIKILPHRYPFLFIDKVLEKHRSEDESDRTGWKIRCVKNVTINENFFTGHFPHRPVVPGVILIEILAQASALCNYRDSDGPQDVALCGVHDAKFRLPVVPGDTLDIHVECKKDRRQMMVFYGQIFVEGKLVCEAEFLARMFNKVV
jgi:3-hydroxyacyl-[acyl-carrier-protein] dehydratase